MVKSTKLRGVLCLLIALILTVSVFMPTAAMADSALAISAEPEQRQGRTVVTDLRITGLEAPKKGTPFPTEATVVSAEGISWQVAVVWTDEAGLPVEGIAGDGPYYPVIVFFVPAEYSVRGSDGKPGSFLLRLDDSVLALFGTDSVFSIFDADRGITYILSGKANASVAQREAGTVPSLPVPGLPEKFRAPEDSFLNPNYVDPASEESAAETEENPVPAEDTPSEKDGTERPVPADDEGETAKPDITDKDSAVSADPDSRSDAAESRTPEIVSIHCAKKAINAMDIKDLAEVVDMVKYRIQPQAVELLKKSFPAYEEAAAKGQLGSQIGLYVYFGKGENDGVMAHNIGDGSEAAFVAALYDEDKEGRTVFKYMLAVNARFLVEEDDVGDLVVDEKTGKVRLKQEKLDELENTIIHEMMHAFMDDYNRTGMSGTTDPALFSGTGVDGMTAEDQQQFVLKSGFPTWFKEGLATSVENNYAGRFDSYNLLSYAGEGVISEWYTPEILRKAYVTTAFKPNPNGMVDERCFDLANKDCDVYVTGYLACLYLGELAANSAGRTSAYAGADGSDAYKSEVIRDGINAMLERLHNGETLDGIIRDISNGAFADTKDFEQNFIKGNEDSASFCTGYLNYMRALSQDKNRKYLPNGSILYPFDCDFATPLDRTKDGQSKLFQIVDSDDFVPSTADLQDVLDAGTSVSYDEYMNCLKVVQEERTQLAAQQTVIDEIVNAVSPDKKPDQKVVDYITEAVLAAQIVDPETKESIILTARGLSDAEDNSITDAQAEAPDGDAVSGRDEASASPDADSREEDPGAADTAAGDIQEESADDSSGDYSDDGWDGAYDDDSGWDEASGWDEDSGWDEASGWDDDSGWDEASGWDEE